uniref:Uncharacterized protein n=1 Tax=Anguilla anguilla TaxID=7936 RepID=A0A0E9X4I8_ANGAN
MHVLYSQLRMLIFPLWSSIRTVLLNLLCMELQRSILLCLHIHCGENDTESFSHC